MVYGGKPSTGCKNCRQRKIKCDEQKPSCTQCTATDRVCPGYPHLFDLVLRDETQSVARKAQRRRRRQPQTYGTVVGRAAAAAPNAPAGGSANPAFEPSSALATIAPSGFFLPRSFHDTPEQQAVNAFFSNYILIPRHPFSERGYLECLLPLYQNTRHDSLLSLATVAMALAIQGTSPPNKRCRVLSQDYFGKALIKTGKAIRDPIESLKDETLIAVLLLSFYERVLATSESKQISGVHDTGAVALVKHRGKENGKSEVSARLLLAVQTQVVSYHHSVDHCIQTSAPFSKTLADLDSLRPSSFENVASRLTSLSAQASDLLAFANPTLRNRNELPSHDQLTAILDHATKVEAQLSAWPESVPHDWWWKSSNTFNTMPSHERKLYVYNRRVDIYPDIWVASVWNSYRSTMLLIQSTILQTLGFLNPPPLSRPAARMVTAINTVQDLVDDICGSVPLNLGTKTFGGPADRAEVRYPDDGVTMPSSDYRKSAASLGGWFLLEPLKTAASVISLREGQNEWILRQIERIQRIYIIE
ncbi:MAG: hypothetical protein LQ341_005208 [Variospora aurantia]|nr:MAG: hypothetical protein LQ341_005208 [Variospora aurantia]